MLGSGEQVAGSTLMQTISLPPLLSLSLSLYFSSLSVSVRKKCAQCACAMLLQPGSIINDYSIHNTQQHWLLLVYSLFTSGQLFPVKQGDSISLTLSPTCSLAHTLSHSLTLSPTLFLSHSVSFSSSFVGS